MFKKLVANDNAIKLIFDHYKNFAVAAVILAVGITLLSEEGEKGFFEGMRIISGACVCSGQLIPDTVLSFSSVFAGANPSLN